jgi:3-hydroxyisobutyrate dehydrogenase-like beta-hydroxyacid dehydrogenase
MRIGFVRIGKIGKPMALRLAGAGHHVCAFDRSLGLHMRLRRT